MSAEVHATASEAGGEAGEEAGEEAGDETGDWYGRSLDDIYADNFQFESEEQPSEPSQPQSTEPIDSDITMF